MSNSAKKTTIVPWIVHGQGVVLFQTQQTGSIVISTEDHKDGLVVRLTSSSFRVKRLSNGNQYASQIPTKGISTQSGAYYWFSLDSQNQVFQAGIGEPRNETACYRYAFSPQDRLWEANKSFLESLTEIQLSSEQTLLRVLKDPVTVSLPPLIKGTNDLTMDDIARNTYLPSACLSASAQVLYQCVSGSRFVLNTPDFPEFSDAIEYSIATPGCWCYERLKQKANEFSKDHPQPLETYLRITLGQNQGESPGIPYVMEIWPVGHYSPVHHHANANAIIRVLHGSIHIKLFPFLCDDEDGVDPLGEIDATKDDITWLSPLQNQIHQLINRETNTETCITIQCYLYDSDDSTHYDYFDYLGDHSSKNQYEPDSDMDFVAFKEKMEEEWNQRPKLRRTRGISASHSKRT